MHEVLHRVLLPTRTGTYPDWEVVQKILERSQDKTADAGKFPELGQIVGRSMVDEDFNQCDVVCGANRKTQCHLHSSKAQLVNNKLLSVF